VCLFFILLIFNLLYILYDVLFLNHIFLFLLINNVSIFILVIASCIFIYIIYFWFSMYFSYFFLYLWVKTNYILNFLFSTLCLFCFFLLRCYIINRRERKQDREYEWMIWVLWNVSVFACYMLHSRQDPRAKANTTILGEFFFPWRSLYFDKFSSN